MWWRKADDELEKLKKERKEEKAKEKMINDLWSDTGFQGATDAGDYNGNEDKFSSTSNFESELELYGKGNGINADSSGDSTSSSGNCGASVFTESERKALDEKGFDMNKLPERRLPSELTAGVTFLTHYVEGFAIGGLFGVVVAGNRYYQGQVGRLSPAKLGSHVSNQIMKSGHNLGTLVGLYHGAKRLSREYRMDYKEAMVKVNRDASGVSDEYTTMDSFLGGFVAGMYPSMKARHSPLRILIAGSGLGLFTAVIDSGSRWSKSFSNGSDSNNSGQQQRVSPSNSST